MGTNSSRVFLKPHARYIRVKREWRRKENKFGIKLLTDISFLFQFLYSINLSAKRQTGLA